MIQTDEPRPGAISALQDFFNEKRPREKRQHGDPAVAGMAVLT